MRSSVSSPSAVVPVAVGARRTAIEAGGFALTEARYAAHQHLPTHAHRRAVLVLVVDGWVRERWGSASEVHPSASLLAIPAGEPHAESFPAVRTRCLIVEVAESTAEVIRHRSRLVDERVAARGATIAGIGHSLARELRSPDAVAPLAVEGLVWQLVAWSERRTRTAAGAVPPWLERVREAMHAGFRGPLRIADLALEADVHPVYLARAFRRHYHCSPAEYIRRLRVDAAGQALAASDAPLARIALASGFADQSHLSRHFRRAAGTSPGRFRQHARDDR